MPTAIEAVEDLADASRAALAQWQALYTQIVAKQGETVGNVTNIINNFNARPLYTDVYVDPVNGDELYSGLTIDKPRKNLDRVIETLGSQGTNILLLADATIRSRWNTFTDIQIQGIQRAAGNTHIPFARTLGFLGTAENSPSPVVGTYSSGLFMSAGSLIFANMNFALPDVPPGLGTRAHLASSGFVNVLIFGSTLTVGSQNASSLFGTFNGGRVTATATMTLGSGAAGHVFAGVAAGADPNALWSYETNLKSA